MKAWRLGPAALAMVFAFGCQPQSVEVPPEEPIVSVYEEPTPTPTATPTPPAEVENKYVFPYADKLQQARDINSDVVGWIGIPGTDIDFPILFGLRWYYSDRDINKEENGIGSIYSHLNFESYEYYNTLQNLVVAGSNARLSQTLFHELHHIQEVNQGYDTCAYKRCGAALDPAALPDFTSEEGRTWDISVCGIEGRWEVWSVYETDSEEPPETLNYNTWLPQEVPEGSGALPYLPRSEADVQEWINTQLERNQFDLGVEVTTADQFLTIYTSGDEHDSLGYARLYFFLKLVEPEREPYWADGEAAAEATPGPEQAE